jgi:cytochrome c-type biogenesis protein CcsB
MKYIIIFFSSTRTMIVLLFVFAFSTGWATFIENDYGTEGARCLVYNSKWFDLLLLIGLINIIAVAIKFRLYKNEKITILLFHIAFVVIIIGAAITRYFGKEGTMHIREGQTTNIWCSSQNYISIKVEDGKYIEAHSYPVLFSGISKNRFSKRFQINHKNIKIQLEKFIPKAEQTLIYDTVGKSFIHIVKLGKMGREDIFIGIEDKTIINNLPILFISNENNIIDSAILIRQTEAGTLQLKAPIDISRSSMSTQTIDTLITGNWYPFDPMFIYNINNVPMVIKEFLPSASIGAQPVDDKEANLPSALLMEIKSDNSLRKALVWGQKESMGQPEMFDLNGIKVTLSYGAIAYQLPFDLKLNKFLLKRYPGSESPSWFESNVTLNDSENKTNSESRIYMNHILKYRGYRFYQSSYDFDEKGTILSVNNDGIGTGVTYLGYLLMVVGMSLSLINRNSRFRSTKKSGTGNILIILFIGLFGFSMSSNGQDTKRTQFTELPVIKKEHAELFGKLLVQDNGGRIEPVNTLASEVLRKVARNDNYNDQGPDQVLLGMMVFPEIWQKEPMIRVTHKDIQKLLGINSKLASFSNFFSDERYGGYILKTYVEDAYRKKPVYLTKFDNEIIRTDERLNICYLVYNGSLLKLFPDPNDSTHKWHSGVTDIQSFKGDDSIFVSLILSYYYDEIGKSIQSGNWQMPDKLIGSIGLFQKKYGKEVVPSEFHSKAEYLYNQLNVFARLTYIYLVVGFILLLMQFVNIFIPNFNIKYFTIGATIIVLTIFIIHSLGLAMRWYIAGHAPWSNGYEALTFIAWATIFAGFIFSKKSGLTISVTAILAALFLLIAHLSWMDPQVTNLVPVLKSYWLVIHVAVITSSYGFLGLGALLAFINLVIMIFENKKNIVRLEEQINSGGNIIEKTLIVGLYLLTIGTFLGAVWANESWGRYWGWDPKETWALITVIVYAIILHVRLVNGFKGRVMFNILSLIGFGSVLMTYFGVNYYLSGLHSYAQGDPIPVPPIVYYSIAVVSVMSVLASYNQHRLKRMVG